MLTFLGAPVHSSAPAYFRIVFGMTLFWEAGRYLTSAWIHDYYVEPAFHFSYWPFTFVRPWPEPFMTLHIACVGAAALMVAIGWFYRASAVALFVGFTWWFLLDQSRYLNHFYLVSLLSFLLVWLPAHRSLSVDALLRPGVAADRVPAWTLHLLRFQLAVPYFFGGIAKLSPDWFAGLPMRQWLARNTDFPGIGGLFEYEPVVQGFIYGGLLGDLLVVPALLFPRTRVLGLTWMLSFHLLNSRLFKIGVFPWMMILATLVFLPSDWLNRLADDLRERNLRPLAGASVMALLGFIYGNLVPSQPSAVNAIIAAVGAGVLGWEIARYGWDVGRTPPSGVRPPHRAVVAALAVWVIVQCTVPLRHLWIPGDVHWTEEGHRWSWHMKLRDKDLDELTILVHVPGEATPRRIGRKHHDLTRRQWSKMGRVPDMLVQYAHHLAEEVGVPGTRVTATSWVKLNGRAPQLLVDPDRDLAAVPLPWVPPGDFILPHPALGDPAR